MDLTALLAAASDLGDSAVITAIAVVATIQLVLWRYRGAALSLLVALVVGAAAIGSLKIALIGCGRGMFGSQLSSPSGHAAMTAAVLGTLSAIMAEQITGWRRFLPPLVALAVTALIAATRVLLGVHTMEEVLIGLGTGALVLGLSLAILRRAAVVRLRLHAMLLAMAVTIAFTAGMHAPAENVIRVLASFVNRSIPMCGKSGAEALETSWEPRAGAQQGMGSRSTPRQADR